MDEIVQGSSTPADSMSETQLTSNSQEASQSVPEQTSSERVFSESEVNGIVQKAKQKWDERYQRLRTEQPEYAQKKYGDVAPSSNGQHHQNSLSESQYRQIAAQEAQRLRDEWINEAQTKSQEEYAKKVVDNFWNKVTTNKSKYEDFEKVTSDIQLANFPNTVQLLAEHVDNASDMFYEFGKDRMKMAELEHLAERSPHDAIVQARRLSESIKKNQEAKNARYPNEPLNQLRPSTSGMNDGVLSFRDLKAKYRN